ncbi:MAG: methyltransferase family protein [Dysgonomonas sp.]
MEGKEQSSLSKSGVKYIFRIGFQLVLQFAIIFIAAGTFNVGRQIVIYLATLFASYIISIMVIQLYNPEVLNERVKNIKVNTKSWDKVLLSLYVIFTFVIMNIFIGLDVRYQWVHINFHFYYIGLGLYIFSTVMNTSSLIENKFFESSSRIQTERGQTVVSTGMYSVVRHPGYSSILVWALSIPLLTGAVCTIIPSVTIIIIIAIRTYLEDNMLKKELEGYIEYSQKTKYRLIPYVW